MRAAILCLPLAGCVQLPDRLTLEAGHGYGDFESSCGDIDNDTTWLAAGLEFPITYEKRPCPPTPPPVPPLPLYGEPEPVPVVAPPKEECSGSALATGASALSGLLLGAGGLEAYRRKKKRPSA